MGLLPKSDDVWAEMTRVQKAKKVAVRELMKDLRPKLEAVREPYRVKLVDLRSLYKMCKKAEGDAAFTEAGMEG